MLALIMSASVMASCSNKNEDDTSDNNNSNITDTNDTSNENDTTDTTDANNGGNDSSNENTGSGTSAADAIKFIDESVYPNVADFVPMMTESRELDLTDTDTISYNTGLTDLSGINSIVLSESGVGSFAYSFIYVITDGSNTADIQKKLGESVQPNKWICVSAEKISSIQLDNDIILIMSDKDRVDAIMGAVVTAAEGVYDNVGDVVNVMG